MKSRMQIGLLILVVGVVGHQLWSQARKINAITALLHGSSTPDQNSESNSTDGDLVRRVQELESQVGRLRAQLGHGDGKTFSVAATNHAGTVLTTGSHYAADGDRDDVFDDAENAVMEALESYNPQIRDRLRAVVQEEQERLREEAREERRERWDQRTEDRLAKLTDNVSLSPHQLSSLTEWLSLERDQITEVFRQARRDHSFGEAREKAQKFRNETNEEVKGLLDDDQFTAYQAMREEEDNRRFGFWRPHTQPTTKKPEE